MPVNRMSRTQRNDLILVAVLTLMGALLRFYALGEQGLWRDEAQGLFIAQKSFPQGIVAALVHDGHPPLYYFIMHFWMMVFGRGELAVRLFAALCGVAVIPLMYRLGRRLFDSQVALVATLIASVLPLHVLYSRQARMYSLVPLLSAVSMLVLWRVWKVGDRWAWISKVVVSVLLIYSHNWGVLLVAAENLYVFSRLLLGRKSEGRRRGWSFFRLWTLSQMIVALCYLPWVPVFLQQRQQLVVMGTWLKHIPKVDHVLRLFNELTSLFWPRDKVYPWVALFAISVLDLTIRRDELGVRYRPNAALDLTVSCLFVPILLGVVLTPKEVGVIPSYVTLVTYPAVCLIISRGVWRVGDVLAAVVGNAVSKSGIGRWNGDVGLPAVSRWIGASVVLVLALLVWTRSWPGIYRRVMSSLREASAELEREAGPEDVIVIAPDYLATTFNFYYHGPQVQVAFPASLGRVEETIWAGYSRRWKDAAEAIDPSLTYIDEHLGEEGRVWFLAPVEAYPNDYTFDQIRALNARLAERYDLVRENRAYRYAVEMVDVFVFERNLD